MKVRVYLQGGLGNQCFIYATARALALRTDSELLLDLDYFEEDKVYKRRFELERYNIAGEILSINNKLIRNAKKIRYGILSRLKRNGYGNNYRCDFYPYNYRELPTDWKGVLTLDGYWQSEKFYYDQRAQILKDFTLKDVYVLDDDPVAQQINAAKCPVFVHMRSYKEVPFNDGAMTVTEKFYQAAIKLLRERLGDGITLFLFSDDLAWAKDRMSRIDAAQGLKVISADPIESERLPAQIRDFELLRMCHHGVVANSSFSRFAAWLGEQKNLELGRQPIYIHNSKKKNGYCPDRWIRIDEK